MTHITNLLDASTSNGDGPAVSVSTRGVRGMYGIIQKTGNAGSVAIYGRLTKDHAWKLVHSFSSDDAVEIVLFPHMYANVSGYVSGEIHVDVIGAARR